MAGLFGKQAALGFVNAVEEAYEHIGRNPASGSPRYAVELLSITRQYDAG